MIDTRDARRAIAGLLLATGAPAPAEGALAADRLRALGWPPLDEADRVREPPDRAGCPAVRGGASPR